MHNALLINYTKDVFNYILFNSGHIYHFWYPAQIVLLMLSIFQDNKYYYYIIIC